jgi:carbonic anhydrase
MSADHSGEDNPRRLDALFENNERWASEIQATSPDFFAKLASQQSPDYLWIGCSDSRVPANQIVDLLPGEVFVHRNVANMVVHTDLNCLTVLQYAVDILRVKHVIVVGHYGCGGIQAAYSHADTGLIGNWLRNIKDVLHNNRARIMALADESARVNLLCELNVISQVANVCHTTIVQQAWRRGQNVTVHGWVYSLNDGLLKDLNCSVDSVEQIPQEYRVGP